MSKSKLNRKQEKIKTKYERLREEQDQTLLTDHLRRWHGNVKATAESLGMPLRTLNWKIVTLGLQRIIKDARDEAKRPTLPT